MADDRAAQSWWGSLPGILTATATAITAIGGLITVLVQAGIFHSSAPPAPPAPPAPAPASVVVAPVVASGTTGGSATPVVNDNSAASGSQPTDHGAAYFFGTWENQNPAPNIMTRVQIRNDSGSVFVHAWFKCDQPDCDLGEVRAQTTGGASGSSDSGMRTVVALYRTKVRDTQLTIYEAPNDQVRVDVKSEMSGPNGLERRARTFLFHRNG